MSREQIRLAFSLTNLNELLQRINQQSVSSYAEDNSYSQVFDQLIRTLYRQRAKNLLLVAEPGVSSGPFWGELARRGIKREHAILKDRVVVLIDARQIIPTESHLALQAIGEELEKIPNAIVAIEGFVNLLCSPQALNTRQLLAFIEQSGCSLLAWITPREYQEISQDTDLLEYFTRIDIPEPDLPLAIRLLQQYSRGLERQFEVQLNDTIVRETAVLASNYVFGECLTPANFPSLHAVR